ncbi:ABC transporter permease [Agromyces silvae]|uniref:ABC transporter permease n=1 Tax=Agromyces silvae TaxID=3388266 RepID=UPI00280BC61B|nr:ABC transporter permease [Agromyces protaetiae]
MTTATEYIDVDGFVRTRVRPYRRVAKQVAVYAGAALILGTIWWLSARAFDTELLFPGPVETLDRLWQLRSILLENTGASMARVAVGFVAGGVLGAALGLGMGYAKRVRYFFTPYVDFFRFIPVFAWFGPILVWIGAGNTSIVLLIVYTSVWVVAINTLAGCVKVSPDAWRMISIYRPSRWQEVTRLLFPAVLPYILGGMRLAISSAFMTVVAAEFLQANEGLGALLARFQTFYDMPGVFSTIICLGLLGILVDQLFVLLTRIAAARYLPNGRLA